MGGVVAGLLLGNVAHGQEGPGLAANYPNDIGLGVHPDVLYFLDFDDETASRAWFGDNIGFGWTSEPDHVRSGKGALEIQHIQGTHAPTEIHPVIEESDRVYVRWYRMWEPGYDFTQHKMPGVYAKAPGASGAGEVPTGYDKYSCKLFVDFERHPRFYTYHPEQQGIYGDELLPNLVEPMQVEAGRWYCFEMMIKANDVPSRNGELKMWIDGVLVGHYEGMRFRDTNDLKINLFTYSAYVGGNWTSERDQKLWDDQIVVARQYIGPISSGGEGGEGGAGGNAGGAGGASGNEGGGTVDDSGVSGGSGGMMSDSGVSDGSGAGASISKDSSKDSKDGCACGVVNRHHGSGLWLMIPLMTLLGRRRWCRSEATADRGLRRSHRLAFL